MHWNDERSTSEHRNSALWAAGSRYGESLIELSAEERVLSSPNSAIPRRSWAAISRVCVPKQGVERLCEWYPNSATLAKSTKSWGKSLQSWKSFEKVEKSFKKLKVWKTACRQWQKGWTIEKFVKSENWNKKWNLSAELNASASLSEYSEDWRKSRKHFRRKLTSKNLSEELSKNSVNTKPVLWSFPVRLLCDSRCEDSLSVWGFSLRSSVERLRLLSESSRFGSLGASS